MKSHATDEAAWGPRAAGPERGEPQAVAVDDRLVRAIGIPTFGLVIPRVTGLLDGISLGRPIEWAGTGLFLALAAAIWHGNRWLLFEQRRHWGWFDHPVRKVVMLLAAIVLFTAPLTASVLSGWYAWLGQPADLAVIQTVVLVNVICVFFVTHVYETVFLIKERESDRVRVAELDRARAEAELAAFLAQVDPHFMFNALNTLSTLVEVDPRRARVFTEHLAELHRYLLRHRGRALTSLDEELRFVADYVALMRIRFGDRLVVDLVDQGADRAARLPPTAIQLLVENAIVHNQLGGEAPLVVDVRLGRDAVVVTNPRRPRRS
jgi:hypothetical protein